MGDSISPSELLPGHAGEEHFLSLEEGTTPQVHRQEVTTDAMTNLQRRNVYVSGLPETYRASEFRDLCQSFGRVEASKLCVDSKCRPAKGYGFALFFEEEDALKCIEGLNGRVLMGGRPLQARIADAAAAPAPLDPSIAHPPISRTRQGMKSHHRQLGASISSGSGPLDSSIVLGRSMSFSSRDDLTGSQLGLATALIPGTGTPSAPTALHAPMQAPIHGAGATQPPGAVGYSLAPFPVPGGYMPVGHSFIPQQTVGMPLFVTMPQTAPVSTTVAQQVVVPTTAIVAPNGYTPQLCSSLVYPPVRME
ncbi:RNA-binding protein RBP10, putative [Trypanosoma equiperdum]|uniref:RNA-binding protein RBP10, putative n=1 Tax=Trypanosoma equiperdum TaxID=5694 RepID=A0A1G4I3B8_TRYEQ|nr:RNA-binding protein RBP10, putative [Trypanosoma equiperdum]